jgi:hypothetical protein
MPASYLSLGELLQRMDQPYRSTFQQFVAKYDDLFREARGSSHNHQAWAGGYIDHIREVMNIAVVLYDTLGQLRPLPFSLSDVLAVLFVHDLEKLWAYEEVGGTWRRRAGFKENAHAFRLAKLTEAGVTLPAELERAAFFVEGEGIDYNARTRSMSPLAAFCHMCDVASARLWHDFPRERDDPWIGAGRSCPERSAATAQPRQ